MLRGGGMEFVEASSSHADFKLLTMLLDIELVKRYGPEQKTYAKHNQIEIDEPAIIGYLDGRPMACGCFRKFSESAVEIKRMFVAEECRRRGYSTIILDQLEVLARRCGFSCTVLETGKGQPEAIGLYRKAGYQVIDNYPPYESMNNSVCMQKKL